MPGRRLLVLVLVAALASLQGCWLQVGFDAGHTRYNDLEDELTAANVDSLDEAWSVDLLPSAAEPMVRGDRVYVTTGGFDPVSGSSAIDARALDTTSGAQAWSHRFVSFCCAAPALDYTSPTFVGAELWTGYLLIYSGPRPVGGVAAPVRLNPDNGATIAQESFVSVSPAVEVGSRVVQVQVSTDLSRVLAVRDGTTLATEWTGALPGTTLPHPSRVAPAVADGRVVDAEGNLLFGFPLEGCGAATCNATWTRDLGAPLSTVVARSGSGEVLTIAGQDLVALAPDTGETLWTAPLGAEAPGLAVTGDTIYVGAAATLRAFAAGGCGAATCEPTWTAPLGTSATSSPVVAGGAVYVGGTGVVEVFPADGCGAATCPSLTSVPVAGPVDHVVVDDGRLFAVSRPTASAARLTALVPSDPA